METFFLFAFMGMICAAILVGSGVVIGDKLAERKRVHNTGCSNVCGDDTDQHCCTLGNNDGQIHCGRIIESCRQSKKDITPYEMNIVLDYYSIGASPYEKSVFAAIKSRIKEDGA